MPNITRTAGSGNFTQYDTGYTAWGTSSSPFSIVANAGSSTRFRSAKFSSLGFAIPSDATILGIRVQIDGLQFSSSFANFASNIVVFKGSSEYGAISFNWPNTNNAFVTRNFGGPTSLWGTTWTPSDINATSFAFAIKHRSAQTPLASGFRGFTAVVWYTIPGSTTILSQSSILPPMTEITGQATIYVGLPSSTPRVGVGGGWGGAGGYGRAYGESIYLLDPTKQTTVQGKSLIYRRNDTLIQGYASISIQNTSDIDGIANVIKKINSTIVGKSNIVKPVSTTRLGKSRIQKTLTTAVNGTGNIIKTVSSTIDGVARITSTPSVFIQGISSILNTTSNDIKGKASVSHPYNTTINGKSTVYKVNTSTILGRACIYAVVNKTIQGKASIKLAKDVTLLGKSFIYKRNSTTLTGKSIISKPISTSITGQALLIVIVEASLSGQASIMNKSIGEGNYAPQNGSHGVIETFAPETGWLAGTNVQSGILQESAADDGYYMKKDPNSGSY